MRDLNNGKAYHLWAKLRDFLWKICDDAAKNMPGGEECAVFERMLHVSHYYAMRSAMMMPNGNLEEVLALALHHDPHLFIIPADLPSVDLPSPVHGYRSGG